MKNLYFRQAHGGGIDLFQIVIGSLVLSLYRNRSASNGDVHGWRVEAKRRNLTAL